MKHPKMPRLSRKNRGFTLIELLVVISIIAILAVSSTAIYSKVMGNVRKQESKSAAVQLAGAIKQWYTEYDTWPVQAGGADWEGQTDDAELIAELSNSKKESKLNLKRMNFLEGMKAAKSGKGGKMEGGLDYDTNPESPALVDPWGSPYRVKFDSDYDGIIGNPDTSGAGKDIRANKVIVWSPGKDGDWDTWVDNVKSWE